MVPLFLREARTPNKQVLDALREVVMAQVVYQSEHATITTERITVQDSDYLVDEIEEVSLYEGRNSMIDAVNFFGPLAQLLMGVVLPSNYDSGLVVARRDGKSDIIQGLEIAEARKIIEALNALFGTDQSPIGDAGGTVPEELMSGPAIVEEGTYKGRKWRRLANGVLEGQLLGGRFKEFASLEEFGKYIS